MRISWLAAEEIAVARQALTADGKSYDDHFVDGRGTASADGAAGGQRGGIVERFVAPPLPAGADILDWEHLAEHVARAERVSAVVRQLGIDAAIARFGASQVAIEEATLAAAMHEGEMLAFDRVVSVLGCAIDTYVFYAPFLELLMSYAGSEKAHAVNVYERFVEAYVAALSNTQHSRERIAAVRDGLADLYASVGRLDEAQALFEERHEEDQRDVAVALTASRAFLAAGSVSHAVRWLGVGAQRATMLGRDDMAKRLREKQESVRKRLS